MGGSTGSTPPMPSGVPPPSDAWLPPKPVSLSAVSSTGYGGGGGGGGGWPHTPPSPSSLSALTETILPDGTHAGAGAGPIPNGNANANANSNANANTDAQLQQQQQVLLRKRPTFLQAYCSTLPPQERSDSRGHQQFFLNQP